jgi:hypothetical protein
VNKPSWRAIVSLSTRAAGAIPRNRSRPCPFYSTQSGAANKSRFVYARDLCEPAERTGHPLGLVAKGSTWYLVAKVEGETRTYRVSRIRQAAALDRPAAYEPDFDLAAHWEHSAAEFREKLPRYYATFLANASVMRWVRYRGWRLEEETLEGDRIRVKLRFDIEGEAVQFALSFGGDIEVIEPGDLREKVLAGARAILGKSRSQPPYRSGDAMPTSPYVSGGHFPSGRPPCKSKAGENRVRPTRASEERARTYKPDSSPHVCLAAVVPVFAEPDIHSLSRARRPSQMMSVCSLPVPVPKQSGVKPQEILSPLLSRGSETLLTIGIEPKRRTNLDS